MFSLSNNQNKKSRYSFFLLLFLATSACSQTQKYELNDPRNPDCPCHKAQKEAEKEYAQLNMAKDKVIPEDVPEVTNNVEPEKNNTIAGTVATHAETFAGKNRRKNKITGLKKLAFRYSRKQRGLRKIHTDYSVCFHNW